MTSGSSVRLLYGVPIADGFLAAFGMGALGNSTATELPIAGGLLAVAVLGTGPGALRRVLSVVLAVTATVAAVRELPHTANHTVLWAIVAWMLTTHREGDDSDGIDYVYLASALLIWSGLQKIFMLQYHDGSALTWWSAVDPRFTNVLGWLFADPLPMPEPGATLPAAPAVIVIMSNAVWIAELVFGIGLLLERFRVAAAAASVGLVISIEVIARELIFGGLMVGLLMPAFGASRWRYLGWATLAVFALGVLLGPFGDPTEFRVN